jgi:polyketide synthase PksL
MGWASLALNPVSVEFAGFCRECAAKDPAALVLDIGAGFGVAALAALRAGVCVVANDLSSSHLDEIALRARQELGAAPSARLTLRAGRFPRDLFFDAGSLAAVHASSVFHFLTGNQLARGLRAIERWLRPGGRLFVQAASPYQAPFEAFIPEYEARRARGERWPGWMERTRDYSTHRLLSQMPGSLHLLDGATLGRAAAEAGLVVERAWLYRRPELSPTIFLDGRESAGLIAVKNGASLDSPWA